MSITCFQVLISGLTLLVTQLEMERDGRDGLLQGLQEGVVVLAVKTQETIYSNSTVPLKDQQSR